MDALFNIIPKKYFVEALKQNTLGCIKIAILREVKGNLIIRSNYPDETITFKVGEKDVVEIPARKLKSKEKLLGLKMCRQFNVVDKDVRYNVINNSKQLGNPNSILFGDSVTESGDAVGISSRAIYDWAYSIRDVGKITAMLQHNALSEGGTMWNEDEKNGKLRQSLFQVQYVKPTTYFPHFITVENVTPELFIHLLSCIIYENRYGAQSTTLGANIKNHIIGVGFANFEEALNSFSISNTWGEEAVTFETVSAKIKGDMETAYGKAHFQEGNSLVSLIDKLWKDEAQLKPIYQKAATDCKQFLKDIGIK